MKPGEGDPFSAATTRSTVSHPESIKKSISSVLSSIDEADYVTVPAVSEPHTAYGTPEELPGLIRRLKNEMKAAARDLEFEKAAAFRDQIKALSEMLMTLGGEVP
jgi:excinuclease ABC subunit B